MNQGKIRNLRVVADFNDDMQNVQGVITQYNEGNIEDCMVTGMISGYMGGNGAVVYPEFGGIAAKNNSGKCIFTCNSAKFRIYNSSPYQIDSLDDLNLIEENQGAYYQLTSDGTVNFPSFSFTRIAEAAGMEYFEPLSPENTGNADAFFAAIRSPGKLKDGKFTVPSDGESGIVYRVICALIFLDQIQIIQRINQIRTAACTISASWFHK